jgi:UDP-glucose 4-epimerase
MTSTIVVTGASGFVGRRLARRLSAHGVSVRTPSRADLDVTRLYEGAGVLKGADGVCHLAAYIPRDQHDPAEAERCMEVNALGTLALLRASAEAGVRRFVYGSSGNVYRPAETPVDESAPIYPSSRAPYYLASKVAGELFADHFGRAGRISMVIARLGSVYGPGMASESVIARFARQLQEGEPVRVLGGGRFRSDLVYVDDVVEGLMRMATGNIEGAVNLGSGQTASMLDVATTLVDLLGADPALVRLEPAGRNGGPSGFAPLDIARARRELDYAPRPLAAGLADYVAAAAPSPCQKQSSF